MKTLINFFRYWFKYRFDTYRALAQYSVQEEKELNSLLNVIREGYATQFDIDRAQVLSLREGVYRRMLFDLHNMS